jgi:UDP-2,3-diacylglucosamine hydrolase
VSRTPRPVAFVGDAHLLAADTATTDAFVAFIAGAPARFERLVLVGDIFDLWLARPHLFEAHHAAVLDALAAARREGLGVDYAVGNRDFGVESLRDAPFDRVASEVLEGPGSAPPPWLAEHGDLVNEADRPYRAWRRLARSAPVLGSYLRLPAVLAVPLSRALERRMRTTNLAYKRAFPAALAVEHARRLFAATGARYLVLGHFHQELRLAAEPGEVLVLPDWKRARRHAEWRPTPHRAGAMSFEDSA